MNLQYDIVTAKMTVFSNKKMAVYFKTQCTTSVTMTV